MNRLAPAMLLLGLVVGITVIWGCSQAPQEATPESRDKQAAASPSRGRENTLSYLDDEGLRKSDGKDLDWAEVKDAQSKNVAPNTSTARLEPDDKPTTPPPAPPVSAATPGQPTPQPTPGLPSRPGSPPLVVPPSGDNFGGSHDAQPGFNTESYDAITDNPFLVVATNPLSTFSIDVDTASYSNVRRFLTTGQRPPRGAVRIEELVNYFPYEYATPGEDGAPFSASIEIAGCPWNMKHRLVRVGLKGREIAPDKRPVSNLVFLLDVSGSMSDRNKLPLVQDAIRLLANQLTENDRVSIAVYAGAAGLVLPATTGDHREQIIAAVDRLQAGGSTAGGAGIELAYKVAAENFVKGGVNRVILCTDGDFNVGISDDSSLVKLIEDKAKSGVFLTVLGFGMGNYKDSKMEKLADKGNGNYAYIDTRAEARKVLVEQLSGTLVTIAKDVKIQVEFNPVRVQAYRLIGYENRMLRKEDFNDDTKDAGEIGAGHCVTALYEIVPPGVAMDEQADVDELKYQQPPKPTTEATSKESLTLKLRYKQPDGDKSVLVSFPATDEGASYSKASGEFKFAAAVAAFGMILRDSPHKGNASYDAVLELAAEGRGKDASGYRAEFIELVKKAKALR